MIVHATVRGGRYVVDEPAKLPKGTVVELVVLEDSLDDMAPDERAVLLAELDRATSELDAGAELVPADVVLARLRAQR